MKKAILLLCVTICFSVLVKGQSAVSTFDVDDEGWKVAGDATSVNPQYMTTGGNPGGFISASDLVTGGVWYWLAPAKFLGNKSSAFNGSLQFDLRQSALTNQFDAVDIYLAGSGTTLVCNLANPGIDWTHYDVPLNTTTDWRINTLTGAAATEEQIKTVLSNITNLRIRGEYITGADRGDLDNVILPGSVLPVKLISFNVANYDGQAQLSWIATNEENSSHFVVEHSLDGVIFKELAKLQGQNQGLVNTAYSYTHRYTENGDHFYRLRMVEKDGSLSFSTIKKINAGLLQKIIVYPNPVLTDLHIGGLPINGISTIRLTDMRGKLMHTSSGVDGQLRIKMVNYPAGVYYLTVTSGSDIQTIQINKQ